MSAQNAASITRATAQALMKAMECDVDSEPCDCSGCEYPSVYHGAHWFCMEHDWHDADHSDGICGYALKLARSVAADLAARDEAVRREVLAEVETLLTADHWRPGRTPTAPGLPRMFIRSVEDHLRVGAES